MNVIINKNTFSGKRSGLFFLIGSILFTTLSLQGADLFSLPHANPEAVVRLDLQKIYETLQNKNQNTLSLNQFHSFIGPASEIFDMNKYCSEVLISVISLRKNRGMVFCKTTLQERDFKVLLQKMRSAGRVTQHSCGKYVLYRITDSKTGEKELFAVWLPGGTVLFSDRDPSQYLLSTAPKGLTQTQRALIKKAYPISGYIAPGKKFYRRNPFLPRFSRIVFHVDIRKDASLICHLEGPLLPGENAEMKQQQLQQTRMMCAILLNNVDPALAEEFMQSGQVYRQQNTLFVRQYLSAAFLKKIFLQGIPMLLSAEGEEFSPARPPVKRKVDRP